jgi:hypothetical protein
MESTPQTSILTDPQAILEAGKAKPARPVFVKALGQTLLMRPITGKEREDLLEIQRQGADDGNVRIRNFRARLVSMSVVNEAGQRVFGPKDIDSLSLMDDSALQELSELASDTSKLDQAAVNELMGILPNSLSEPSGDA